MFGRAPSFRPTGAAAASLRTLRDTLERTCGSGLRRLVRISTRFPILPIVYTRLPFKAVEQCLLMLMAYRPSERGVYFQKLKARVADKWAGQRPEFVYLMEQLERRDEHGQRHCLVVRVDTASVNTLGSRVFQWSPRTSKPLPIQFYWSDRASKLWPEACVTLCPRLGLWVDAQGSIHKAHKVDRDGVDAWVGRA